MVMAAVAVAAVGTAYSIYSGEKAKKAAKRANRAAAAQQRLEAWAQSMESLRNYQRAQASAAGEWEASGASLESSGAQGVQSSLGATEMRNQEMGEMNVQAASDYYKYINEKTRWEGRAAIGQSIANIAMTARSLTGGRPSGNKITEGYGPWATGYRGATTPEG